jgi:glutathione S-transferase
MSPQIKPIKVWGQGGPNPPKVAFILEELDLPYEIIATPLSDIKKPEYLAINPNGRLPSIHDPNTNLTLWESGAIVEYLIEVYDTKHQFSFAPGTPESYHAKQWLFFQVSGQGPYFGQLGWFLKFHAEQLPSAIERYVNEVNRVVGVLEGWLAKQKQEYGDSDGSDGPWLVGNKYSYADIAFIQWQRVIAMVTAKDQYNLDNFPHVKEWLGKMTSREAIKIALRKSDGPPKSW